MRALEIIASRSEAGKLQIQACLATTKTTRMSKRPISSPVADAAHGAVHEPSDIPSVTDGRIEKPTENAEAKEKSRGEGDKRDDKHILHAQSNRDSGSPLETNYDKSNNGNAVADDDDKDDDDDESNGTGTRESLQESGAVRFALWVADVFSRDDSRMIVRRGDAARAAASALCLLRAMLTDAPLSSARHDGSDTTPSHCVNTFVREEVGAYIG